MRQLRDFKKEVIPESGNQVSLFPEHTRYERYSDAKRHLGKERFRKVFPIGQDHQGNNEPQGETCGEGERVWSDDTPSVDATLAARDYKGGNNLLQVGASRGRGNNNVQKLEIREDGLTNTITSVQKDNLVIENELKQVGNVDTKGHNSIWGRVYDPDGIAPTINSEGGGMGAKTGLWRTEERIRRLTPVECERLQGFPDGWTTGSDSQRYKMCGNAVTTNVIRDIAKVLFKEEVHG